LKYIKKLAESDIWNSGKIELFDFSRANLNQESREEAVTFVASECYGSEPTDRKKLYNKLMTEHCGGPTSSAEFVRCWDDTSIGGSLRNNKNLRTFENTISDIMGPAFFTSACFNSVATFRLKVPIFLARQIMRHRSFSAQEMSRRYQDNEKSKFEFWSPDDHQLSQDMSDTSETAEFIYKRAVKGGTRPEVARAVMPQSTLTEFFIQGDIPAWANYFNVRLGEAAQKEHRDLAKAMFAMLREHQPRFFEHMHGYVDNGSEMGYNSSDGRIDVKEAAKSIRKTIAADLSADRPDRHD